MLAFAAAAAVVLSLAARAGDAPTRQRYSFGLSVVDEAGRPIGGAVFSAGRRQWQTDASGHAEIAAIPGVLAGALTASGYLAEPVVVGRESDERVVTVRLWASRGGRRFSYHAAGDVMLGRRYLEPRQGASTARLDPERLDRSAREIVAEVAPIFAASTFGTVNLETVVGNLPPSAASPGKDLVLQTPEQALAALDELGVDAALGANNHVRDYGDSGIAATRRAVEEHDIAYGGAGLDEVEAARPVRLRRGLGALVVLAFSGLTGDSVNDAYSDEPGLRRAGGAWRVFRELERRDPAAARRAWPSLIAVYPELQDWVARRGHGGANEWDTKRASAAIREAARGAAPVVVQLQRGFQYAPAPPVGLIGAARAAIDAGADIVLAHHPHVLQGFEWYRGKLIAYSLGNFVFDQDLLVTYPGGFLRTVWDGERLLEARFVPTTLAGYRPLPVAGSTAASILRRLAADSVLPARSSRRGSSRTRLMPRRLKHESLVAGHLDRNTLVLDRGTLEAVAESRDLRPGEVQRLSRRRLYTWGDQAAPPGALAGRDLLRDGSFDDEAAGADGVLHWSFGPATSREVEGDGHLVLRRSSVSREPALARPVSRVPIADASLLPASKATYELRFRVRLEGKALPSVRLYFYRFDAGGLSIVTGSVALGRQTVRLELVPDGRWREMTLAISPPHGADYLLPCFVLAPSGAKSALALDDVTIVEWRPAAGRPHPLALDYVRNAGRKPLHLRLLASRLGG